MMKKLYEHAIVQAVNGCNAFYSKVNYYYMSVLLLFGGRNYLTFP